MIRYFLEAEFIPINSPATKPKNFSADDELYQIQQGIPFKTIISLPINKQTKLFQPQPFSLSLQSKVGGFLGIGTTLGISTIIFDRNIYHLG